MLQIKRTSQFSSIQIGASVAIDGVCLTVTSFDAEWVEFFVMEETKKLTTFGTNSESLLFQVNVELAICEGESWGGHVVQGHVHETATLTTIDERTDGSRVYSFQCAKHGERLRYKDSIAVSGVSLTISEVCASGFAVSLIPHTLNATTLGALKVGERVNIEYNMGSASDSDAPWSDDNYMMLALEIGELGRHTAPPNPWVGCVIVNGGKIIGRGFHLRPGEAHAEIAAIENAIEKENGDLLKGATLYVTLEPCCHVGKTGPCVNAIIEHKIARVVYGILDPDLRVKNRGVFALVDSGIAVEVASEKIVKKIEHSLRSYIHHRTTGTPFMIIKKALSIDGHPALRDGTSKFLTGKESRAHSHEVRAQSQAIVIGSRTAIEDNPNLTAREFVTKRQPLRVLLDRSGKVIKEKILHDGTPILILTSPNISPEIELLWESLGHTVLKGDLKTLYQKLIEMGIVQCLVEGGAEIQSEFMKLGYAQELHIYRGNVIVGTTGTAAFPNCSMEKLFDAQRLQLIETRQLGKDVFSAYEFNRADSDIEIALDAIAKGRPVIVMDDASRENEGDLVVAAEFITPEIITFMKNHTTGILCVSMDEQNAHRLGIERFANNTDGNQTPFGLSLDLKTCKTGVSSSERCDTILEMARADSTGASFSRPGHIFPLIASAGGLFQRRGHTEASVELCRMAGVSCNMAVIGELVKEDGEMMRIKECREFAEKFWIPFIRIADIKARLDTFRDLRATASCSIQLKDAGEWTLVCYDQGDPFCPHRVLIKGRVWNQSDVLVRVHSECFTGDVLKSLMCDCGEQLAQSIDLIAREGQGVIIFPANHEGRGIGLSNKVRAYKKMADSRGAIDTFEANVALGFAEDARTYDAVRVILRDLKLRDIRLLTRNPKKRAELDEFVRETISVDGTLNAFNKNYLETKNKVFLPRATLNKVESACAAMSTAGQPEESQRDFISIAIVSTYWHEEKLDAFKDQIIAALPKNAAAYSFKVPGAFEIPIMAKRLANRKIYDAVICIGAILKGDTAHFEYISNATINGLMNAQLETDTPIINAVLNCYTIEQMNERLNESSGLGKSIALSALRMIDF